MTDMTIGYLPRKSGSGRRKMTKQYRLKKDLPTFKAGDEFYLDVLGDLRSLTESIELAQLGMKVPITLYSASTLKKFPNILTEWFEEIPEKPKTVWDLKEGDELFILTAMGVIQTVEYSPDDPKCRDCINAGSGFVSIYDAAKELARRKAKVILERDTKGFKPDWVNLKEPKFYVRLSIYCGARSKEDLGTLQVEKTVFYATPAIYFATAEDAEASIKAHEKEWKIYLGVEE